MMRSAQNGRRALPAGRTGRRCRSSVVIPFSVGNIASQRGDTSQLESNG
jgi:hypothetical protein